MNSSAGKKLKQEILSVFFYVVVCVYSWSLLNFFWDLPAFLLRFSAGEIIGFLSYQLAYALFESVVVTLFVIALIFLIPLRRVRNKIPAMGGLLVLSFAISAIVFKEIIPIIAWFVSFSMSVSAASKIAFAVWLFTLLGLPILSVASTKSKKVTDAMTGFSENLSVLAQLYAALGIAGVFVVIYRNL